MARDILFVLKPNFQDKGQGPYYCPESAELTGLLDFYPQLRDKVVLRSVEFTRPRSEVVAMVGPQNQSCPVLVLGRPEKPNVPEVPIETFQGRHFVEGAKDIGKYFAHTYGIGSPH